MAVTDEIGDFHEIEVAGIALLQHREGTYEGAFCCGYFILQKRETRIHTQIPMKLETNILIDTKKLSRHFRLYGSH